MTFEKLEKNDDEQEVGVEMECGENIHMTITCMRHGPKEGIGDAPLSKKAEESIKKSIDGFNPGKDGIKVFVNETKRTQGTGKIISESLDDCKRRHIKIPGLEHQLSGKEIASIVKIIKMLLPDNYENLEEGKKKEIYERIEDETMIYFLEDKFSKIIEGIEEKTGETFPDKMKDFSHLEMASRFAEWINLCVSSSKHLPKNTEINLINVSHDFNLISFLKETIVFEDDVKAKNIEAREFLDKIGGGIKTAEFFNIDIRRKDKENFEVHLEFRGKDYNLDFSEIEKLTKLARENRKNRK